ncbi:hypothetical protein [Streptomyces sp. A012304]|uniref:hypothetical protein n=1 Tax=Streptomyces sp. A012304 TaxID=375446 RepID=UPI002232B007|nr:hypothetical protein [Streptomyces sp. A012304]GKQ41583.1 hypothetical protein ALMP_80970 [Streptomyces sp. A012304]
MGTKTVDEDGAATGAEAAEAKRDDEATDVAATGTGDTTDTSDTTDEVTPAEAGTAADGDTKQDGPTGVGQGAGAVVSAALGLVSLTGGWVGTVASARETLVGQLETSTDAGVAQQIQAVYGDAWQTTALWAGLFALAALITGVVVLARPAFGAPGRPQAPWIKSVAWAGITLGVVGLLLAVLKYTDALLGLPSAS